MSCCSSPPELVIIHRWEIIVYQGIGMNHLNRNRDGIQLYRIQIEGFTGCLDQQRSDALSTSEDRGPERLMQF